MEAYRLHIPTQVYFGRNIWRKALDCIDGLIQGNVLVVTTGRSLLHLGYLDELEAQIKKNPLVKKLIRFEEVSANPKLSEARKGILLGRQEKIDRIVGFGGGSALDMAKAIAVGIGTGKDIEELFYSEKSLDTGSIPVIAMPTTAGTGSELSKAAILSDEVRKVKSGLRGKALCPALAIVDSVFTESVPIKTTMETGFDVLAHAVESYVAKAASPYTRMQSEYAVHIVGKYLPRLSVDLQDTAAREKMSFASLLMGINLGHSGTCLPHRLQYPLGAYTDTSHGAGLAAMYPAWISCEYRYAPDQIEKLLRILTGEDVRGESSCVKKVQKIIKQFGLATSLSELGVDRGLLDVMSTAVTGNIDNDLVAQMENCVPALYQMAY